MKCLSLILVGRLSRAQRRAGVLMLLLALAAWRPLWSQSVLPAAKAAAQAAPRAEPDTVRAALAHALAAQAPLPGAALPVEEDCAPEDRDASPESAPRAPRGTDLLSGMQFFGQKSLPFRWVSVSGSANARRAFENHNSRFGNLTELTVMGRLLETMDVNLTLSDTPHGAENRRVAARFKQGDLDLRVGDVSASFDGNGLVPFQRRVHGAVAERRFGEETRVVALVSTGRSATRRVVVPGNNTVGPYYLNAFPIVPESVRVRVDDTEIPPDAYTVDAYAGTITFLGGRVVPQTSVLRVHFATRDGSGGMLYGARVTHRLEGGHSLGVTAMTQETAAAPEETAHGRERLDDWPAGHADSAGPYQLRHGPVVRGSERVFVGGVLQQAGIDYVIDAERGVIQFGRLILSSEPIRVIYRQRVEPGAEPAGQVVGVDGTFRLGKSAQVTAQVARSMGGASATGNAITLEGKVGLLEGDGGRPRLRLGAAVQSIDPTFSPLDAGAFLRNDRGLSLDGEFAVNPYTRVYSRWQQGERSLGAGGAGNALRGESVAFEELVAGAQIRYPGWPALTLQSSRTSQDGRRGDSRQATDSIRLEYDRSRFRAAAEWGRGEMEGQPLADLGTAGAQPATTETTKLSVAYSPNDRLSLSANGVWSDVRQLIEGRAAETTARSVDLNAAFRASRTVQLSASYGLTDGGAPGRLSPGAGGAGRLPLNGRDAGARALAIGDWRSASVYGGNRRTSRLGVTYTPGRRFNLSASLDATDSELYGESAGHSLGFTVAPLDQLTLTASRSRQASRLSAGGTGFGGSGLDSDLTYLSLRAGPFGRFLVHLDYQHLAARGGAALPGSGYAPSGGLQASETRSWTGRLSHPIGGHTAFVQYQNVDYGGASSAARKASATAGVDLRLGRVLGLTLDLELHRYRDERRPADGYRARIVSGNLSARF